MRKSRGLSGVGVVPLASAAGLVSECVAGRGGTSPAAVRVDCPAELPGVYCRGAGAAA
jgi:hypothetical protein